MARPELKVYFDILSPFAYIAFHVITTTKIFDECDVKWVPALLGAILKETGNTAPLFIKNKDKWINQERQRSSKLFNVPMHAAMPPGFPVATANVQRHMAALSEIDASKVVPAAAALYEHFFVHHGGVKESADFLPVLEAALGDALAQQVHAAAPTAGKARLEANTAAAVADGAFGMPWFVATAPDGQQTTFWGVDHLGQHTAQYMFQPRPAPQQHAASDRPLAQIDGGLWGKWMDEVDERMWGAGLPEGDALEDEDWGWMSRAR